MKTGYILMFAALIISMAIVSCSQSESKNVTVSSKPANAPAAQLSLQVITNQIPSPVAMAVTGDGSNRLFICEKQGRVWVVQNAKMLSQPFLDVSNQMVDVEGGYDERGLLGIAFHPNFKTNRKFYVYYSAPSRARGSDHKSVVAEYRVSAGNANAADKSTKRVLLEVEQPESNHNGGDLVFGPDGYLYICLGDGGGGGDKHGSIGNGQNLSTLLGKILRIDVNGNPYSVPKDNPFVSVKNARPEIWAYGLRNPWRISFDKATKQLFAGDVGQNKYEEIDIIQKGGNYGWRIKEGLHDFKVPDGANKNSLIDPIYEYDHDQGISISGGYIYRGRSIPELTGKYVYGDYNGKMWLLSKAGNKWVNSDLMINNKPGGNMQILSWGQDEAGELYMLINSSGNSRSEGSVYKIVKK